MRLSGLVLAAAALMAAGCGDDGGSGQQPAPASSTFERATPTPIPVDFTPPVTTPLPTGSAIPVGDPGSVAWTVPGPEDWYAWPVASADGATLYFGSGPHYNDDPAPDPGAVTSVDAATGTVDWRFETPSRAFWPAEHGGVVFVGTRDGTVFAIDAASGAEVWRYETGGVPVVVLANGHGVFAADGDPETYGPGGLDGPTRWAGRVWALDSVSGGLRWSFETGADIAYLTAPDDRVFVASYGGRDDAREGIWAIEAASGAVIWDVAADFVTSPPVVAADLLVVPGSALTAYRLSDGAPVWGQEVPGGGGWYHPATDGERVFTASNTHHLALFDASTGTPIWTTGFCDCSFLASIDGAGYAMNYGHLVAAPADISPEALQPGDFWTIDLDGVSASRPLLLHDLVVIGHTGGITAYLR